MVLYHFREQCRFMGVDDFPATSCLMEQIGYCIIGHMHFVSVLKNCLYISHPSRNNKVSADYMILFPERGNLLFLEARVIFRTNLL